jgi:hypothetical protein
MPKIHQLQSNFSAGELSPKADGRVDIARYPHAAKRMQNVIAAPLGGARKRAGTQYIAGAKHNDKKARLIPYIIDRDNAYMIEAGDLYMRFYKPDGTRIGAPYEIVTPYTEAFAQRLDYAQGEGEMYIFDADVFPNRLRTFGDQKWDLSAAPFSTTPFSEEGEYPATGLTLSANTVGVGRTMTAGAAVFLASDVGRAITQNAGIFVITGFTSTTVVTGEVRAIFDGTAISSGTWNLDSSPQTTLTPSAATPVGAGISLTLSADGWRAADVGKFVVVNGGLVKIFAFTSALVVSAVIVRVLTSAIASPALAWTLESASWNAINGYPRTGALHEQRLFVGGTKKNPQTVYGSTLGELLDFTKGTNDDEAFTFTLASTQSNPINYITSARRLLINTYGGEYVMQGGQEKPITPTNVQVKLQTPHGAANIKPVQVGKETVFVQRAARKMRAMAYDYAEDGYKAPDITTLAEHITETGIAGIAFQQEPEPIVWAWLDNGRLISCTVDRELDVIAFTRHEVGGAVESVAVMPAGDEEQVWLIVRRVVNGAVKRYVERMQPNWFPIYGTVSPDSNTFPIQEEPFSWGYQLDSAVTADNATGTATWAIVGHLAGETVRCLADGVDMGDFVATAGSITLPRTAKRVLIGKMFAPVVEMLTPEIPGGAGTSQGSAMSTSEFLTRVYNTLGLTINGALVIPGRSYAPDQLDFPPVLFSGDQVDKGTTLIGWAKGRSEITLSQDSPMPWHVLATIRTLTVNSG